MTQMELRFSGADYQPDRDYARLEGQAQRVFDLMRDRQWRTLEQIVEVTGDPHASVSAQLRHLRKPCNGGHNVTKRYVGSGLYEYQLIPNVPE